MAEHEFIWGLTSILSIQWASRALFLDIGRHAWLEEGHLGFSNTGAYLRFVDFVKHSCSQ